MLDAVGPQQALGKQMAPVELLIPLPNEIVSNTGGCSSARRFPEPSVILGDLPKKSKNQLKQLQKLIFNDSAGYSHFLKKQVFDEPSR